ncbi:MAG: hypothetical protein U0573_02795 [Phycisphaerales bacterium]|nr:hypothetical protein [Planctomycetota bacterium]
MTWIKAIVIAWFSLLFGASALASPRKPSVLYIHSDTAAPANVADVVAKLQSAGVFESVATFDGGLGTPTIDFLINYDAALVANHQSWADKVAMGSVLADYVDAGFGVVLAPFANAGIYPDNGLAGRWTGNYNTILFSQYAQGPAALGTITLPDHLPSSGVQTFSGGSSSFRPSTSSLQPGSNLCLSWSDGKPLAAFGPLPNRADIGFYPTSSDVNPAYWNSATDGLKIMVNSLLFTIRPKVLICAAAALDSSIANPRFTDPRNRLRGTGYFSAIDLFDANLATPTLSQLKKYDAVLTWTNVPLADPVAFGNVLADYVDWGGGVVAAMFATSGSTTTRIQGRWLTGGYQLIDPSAGYINNSQATLGTSPYPTHPCLALVSSFDGGTSSFRPASNTLPSHAITVSQWSDGKPLVVVSSKFHNRCDLGMYPPSSLVSPNFWNSSTSGAFILGNAVRYTTQPYVAVLHSETSGLTYLTQNRLFLLRRFSAVDLLPGLQTATPSAATLRPYHALLVWGSTTNFLDATAVGNNLADFVDAGGGVVVGLYSTVANPGISNNRPRGRWISQGYDITPENLLPTSTTSPNATIGARLLPNHPVNTFVRKFDGGTASVRQSSVPDIRGHALTRWSDGKTFASIHNFRKRIDLGFYPASSQEYGPGWLVRTDGALIEANALGFAANMKPCPGDFNGDGFVDDLDFVFFADAYAQFLTPEGDLTGDGLSDDLDFAIFADSYNHLACP